MVKMRSDLLLLLSLVPKENLKFCTMEATLKPDDRWEMPFTNNHKIRFENLTEIQTYIQDTTNKDVRILSINIVYSNKIYIYYDVLCAKLKIYNSSEMIDLKTLRDAGLLGGENLIQYFEIVF
jgi:hypothetical protein